MSDSATDVAWFVVLWFDKTQVCRGTPIEKQSKY
jgi:hypothetical protein